MESQINWAPVAKKIEDLIKQKIRMEGLVKTGKLIESIKVTWTADGDFTLMAEDYFWVLDEKYKIMEWVYNSNEFADLYIDFVTYYFERELETAYNSIAGQVGHLRIDGELVITATTSISLRFNPITQGQTASVISGASYLNIWKWL